MLMFSILTSTISDSVGIIKYETQYSFIVYNVTRIQIVINICVFHLISFCCVLFHICCVFCWVKVWSFQK